MKVNDDKIDTKATIFTALYVPGFELHIVTAFCKVLRKRKVILQTKKRGKITKGRSKLKR